MRKRGNEWCWREYAGAEGPGPTLARRTVHQIEEISIRAARETTLSFVPFESGTKIVYRASNTILLSTWRHPRAKTTVSSGASFGPFSPSPGSRCPPATHIRRQHKNGRRSVQKKSPGNSPIPNWDTRLVSLSSLVGGTLSLPRHAIYSTASPLTWYFSTPNTPNRTLRTPI